MKRSITPTTEIAALHTLSQREHEVFLGLALGATNREIGAHYNVSVKTIDTHRGHVLKKLAPFGVRGNADLARLALRSGEINHSDRWDNTRGVVRGSTEPA